MAVENGTTPQNLRPRGPQPPQPFKEAPSAAERGSLNRVYGNHYSGVSSSDPDVL